MSKWFAQFGHAASRMAGHYLAFVGALGLVAIWALSGPLFHFSSTWQLVINTGTTIITFLMVFLVQNSQNRDTAALHIKLDEIIKSLNDADNTVLDAEEDTEEELDDLRNRYEALSGSLRSRSSNQQESQD